ncbi:endonuclease/exonuclease/phosphatase family protein [Verrucomicrobiaceae bacterium 227]
MHRLLVSVGLLQAALGGELRVVSYNIKHGRGMDGKIDLERVAAVIAQKKPHLVALQEVDKDCKRSGNRDIAAELAKLLGMEHRFGKSIDHDGGEYGVAVLSKLPISGLHHYKLPGGPEPRTALEVQVTVKGHAESVSFVSVHNDWTSEEVRVGQVTALLDHLKERKHPVIIAGDFNGEMNDASVKLFGEKGWKVLDKKGVKTYPSDKPEIEIDFVVTRGLKAELLEHGAMEERIVSDHWPIFAAWKFTGK